MQRGLGRGACQAGSTRDAPALVSACLRRDYRWDWGVDERDVYLARLVRDLRMPIAPIAAQLYEAPPRASSDGNMFKVVLGALEVLGRANLGAAVEAVRFYAQRGARWVETLETIAGTWPTAWWDDLCPTLAERIDDLAEGEGLTDWQPWSTWAERDERIATAIEAGKRRWPDQQRRFADESTGTLMTVLRQADRADDWADALYELRRRPPEPELLDLAEDLAGHQAAWALHGTIEQQGALALPAARRWIKVVGHPLTWTSLRLLAAHGDVADAPALVSGLDWLDANPDERCGYNELASGLARIGGPMAEAVAPRLHQLWFSPHSYERAAYLRALVTLDPAGAQGKVVEGLWDCEADVRLLAVRHTPLDDWIRDRLRYLRDDPIETAEVRAAAMDRLI